MSTRWPGGLIKPIAPVLTGNSVASGLWTLDQQAYWRSQNLWPDPSQDPSRFIENLFSTFLYTGNGSTQTINNGIDLAGKGGMVWIKPRNNGAEYHNVFDTVRGAADVVFPNVTDAAANSPTRLTSFNSNGFTVGSNSATNGSGTTEVSWTFREQPKFFDVVTYTGNGSARTISHNLGSAPGMIFIKSTSQTSDWQVYHRSIGANFRLVLNATTQAIDIGDACWNSTNPTSTVFSLGTNSNLNTSGQTYVAYLFAHNAGGFGAAGTDNVISCGSFTGLATVDLGFEPQFILYKTSGSANSGWLMVDNMRGFTAAGSDDAYLEANNANAEASGDLLSITSTGFKNNLFASDTFIYMAIRRGPMAVPTVGTSVFSPITNSDGTGTKQTTGFVVDLQALAFRPSTGAKNWMDRLRGVSTTATNGGVNLQSTNTGAEFASTYTRAWDNTGYQTAGAYADTSVIGWNFRRAPGFFDVVCWAGNSTNPRSISHNLTVAPTLIITKKRNGTDNWLTGFNFTPTSYNLVYLNTEDTRATNLYANVPVYSGDPTSSVFIVGNQQGINDNGFFYVSYLFATCPGVSKVGSYTGTGAAQIINCEFTAGARFVLVKRVSGANAPWYVWDSARGIVAGNDPYLLLNSTAAEVTNTNYLNTTATGFEISSTAPAEINASGSTYLFLAVA